MQRAVKQFQDTLNRSAEMLQLSYARLRQKQKKAVSANEKTVYEDNARAGIVLAVAAMDAFFTRRFAEILIPYLKRRGPSKDLIELLQEAGFGIEKALQFIARDRPYRHIRSLIDDHLEKYTTQKFESIDELFICIGLKDLSKQTEKLAKRSTLLSSIHSLVRRRHEIVHGGDYNKHGRLVPIDFRRIIRRIKDLILFVNAADQIITNLERKLK